MSNIVREAVDDWKATGIYLTREMYEDGRSRNPSKNLTNDQLWVLLEQVRVDCFENYQKVADEMGW